MLGLLAQSPVKKPPVTALFSGVNDGSRNSSAARVLGRLLHKASPEDLPGVHALAQAWNNTNKPPLNETELWVTLKSVASREFSKQTHNEITLTSWRELNSRAYPPTEWFVQGLLQKGSLSSLVSESGVGKTWLAMEIARCVCLGTPLFDRFPTKTGKVLYLDGENGERALQEKCRILQFDKNHEDSFYISSSYDLCLNSAENVSTLKKVIEQYDITLVIIDTFRGFSGFDMDENSAAQVREFYQRLLSIRDTGVTILVLDHTRKLGPMESGNPRKSQVLGSQDKVAAMDGVIILKKNNLGYVEVYNVKQRNAEEAEPFAFQRVRSGNFMSLQFQEIEAVTTKRDIAKDEILALLQPNPERSFTIKEIQLSVKTSANIGRDSAETALKELVKERLVEAHTEPGNRAILYRYALPVYDVDEETND